MKAAPQRPADALAELAHAMGGARPPALVVLTNSASARGDEPHFVELALRTVLAAARARGAEVGIHDAAVSGFDASSLYAALTTRSLFASSSVRVLKNADALLKGRGATAGEEEEKESPKRSREAAIHPIERAALTCAAQGAGGDQFVLAAKKLRAPFVRAAREAGGLVLEFRPLYDKPFRGSGPVESTELGEFAARLAKERRVRLGAGALAALLTRTGNQLGAVDAALEKLQAILGDREVTVAAVAEHVLSTRPGSPFVLAEAILAGDAPRALAELRLLERFGARDADGKAIASEGAYAMALSAAVRDARRNHDAARRARAGGKLEEIAASLGIPPFPAAMDSFLRGVRARDLAGHRRLLDDLLEAELAMRVRREPAAMALERLACRARVASARAAAAGGSR